MILAYRLVIYIHNVAVLQERLRGLVNDLCNRIYVEWARELEEYRRAYFENNAQDLDAHEQMEQVNESKRGFDEDTKPLLKKALDDLLDMVNKIRQPSSVLG